MLKFCWRVGNLDFALMEVRPDELRRVRKKDPHMRGRPVIYAMVDGEPEWWPQTVDGWPLVWVDRP